MPDSEFGSRAGTGPACALPLGRDFFAADARQVAVSLLGKLLCRDPGDGLRWGRIVEVEAYCGPEDAAAHSHRGETPRNRPMFGPPGHAYVYFIYGMHHCVNVVTAEAGIPHAVLIRALEPGPGTGPCHGPARLCRALAIGRELSGTRLEPPRLYIADDGYRPTAVYATPRIGVDYADEWAARLWRYCLASPHLSRRLPSGVTAFDPAGFWDGPGAMSSEVVGWEPASVAAVAAGPASDSPASRPVPARYRRTPR